MPISLMEGLGGRHVEWRFSPPAFLQWGTRYTMELNITVPNWKGSTGIELFSFNSKRKQRAHMFSRSFHMTCAIVNSCSRIFWNFLNPSYFSFHVVIFPIIHLSLTRVAEEDPSRFTMPPPSSSFQIGLYKLTWENLLKMEEIEISFSFRGENWRKFLTYLSKRREVGSKTCLRSLRRKY